ncbi:MAG: 3,4-dihydroxyphenylacetate 2,3-dioxygenase [Gammaproteobacteria bacterium]|nr:3,4-dihydroxyphenylacetate 2,3-dioxygenase [Gammaproteobacteria bacterium]
MPLPATVMTPPFNVVRCSHIDLAVTDLDASAQFYEQTLGLKLTERTSDALYLRALEERNHHSFVLRKADTAQCNAMGFKVASEQDLDLAYDWFTEQGLYAEWVGRDFQGRTLLCRDPLGSMLEFYAQMDQVERLLQKYGEYRVCHPQRIDHFNCFSNDVQQSVDFYSALGFRTTEYTSTDDGEEIWAAWMHRKGTVHDIAFTNGWGPRLHHVAIFLPSAMHLIHLCDVMSTTGYLDNMERGPGRHGISNAFFLYVRDPDGHRVEIYASDYLTVDPDLEPIRWSLTDTQRQTLWGTPAPKSWFEEGSTYPDTEVVEPKLKAQPIIAH